MRLILFSMTRGDDEFELRFGRIGREAGSGLKRVRIAVRMRAKTRDITPSRATSARTRMRNVIVRARLAVHAGARLGPLRSELRYLARSGQAPARGEPGLVSADARSVEEETPGFYNGLEAGLDGEALIADLAKDMRHLRLIISAEDAAALGDLKPFIREIMARLEVKVASRLDWLAIDHWDTSHPHTHVLVRLKASDDRDITIPIPILVRGIRQHAQEIATRALGPRTAADLTPGAESHILGPTVLDRRLVALADASGFLRVNRPDLIARLDVLDIWGLASREGQGWRIATDLTATLQAMERHAEVEQTLVANASINRQLPVLAADTRVRATGVLVHTGPGDVFGESLLGVIETGRGELRYQRFSREHDIAQLRHTSPGAIIAFQPTQAEPRRADHAIAAIAARTGGVYSAAHHFAVEPHMPRSLVESNLRRLEGMERASLIARTQMGDFFVGEDHLKRARLFEEGIARRYPLSAVILSYLSLDRQLVASGPTYIDRVLAGEATAIEGGGEVARRAALALNQRRAFLITQGWMRSDDAMLPQPALARMAARELREQADALALELGRPVLIAGGNVIRGAYVRRIDLAQGRMALISADDRAALIAWKPGLERFEGQMISAVLPLPAVTPSRVRAMGLTIG